MEEALYSVIWYSAVDGYAERDNRDAFTRCLSRGGGGGGVGIGNRNGEFFTRPMHAHLLNRNNAFLMENSEYRGVRMLDESWRFSIYFRIRDV